MTPASIPSSGLDGEHKLLTEIVDLKPQTDPDAVWLEYPRSSNDYDSGFVPITYRSLANATNGLAWYLRKNIVRVSECHPIAYVGQNDARYFVMLYACIKAGFKVLFSSPKNSVSAHLSLFSSLQCSTIVTTRPMTPAVEALLPNLPLQVLYIPSLEELLEDHFDPFPYTKPFLEARNDAFVVLHTSGSTGNPKPVTYTHEFWLRNAQACQLATPSGFLSLGQLMTGRRCICLLPLFHMAGHFLTSILSHFCGGTIVLPRPNSPPTADTLHHVLQHAQAHWASVSPATVDGLGSKAELLQSVSEKLDRIAFLGGNPSLAMGHQVSRKIKIANLIGSSECGGYAQLIPEQDGPDQGDLWSYVHIHPQTNPVFHEHSAGLFELSVEREQSCEPYQPIFATNPNLDEFATNDLFAPHPTAPGFWRHQGRVDIIVFLNGEKTNPIGFESHVNGHPDVSAALVFGTGRMEAGILIELAGTAEGEPQPMSNAEMIKNLWPCIEEANASAPAHARIAQTHVCFLSPEKPMMRTAKGTIKRRETLRAYADEIAETYRAAEMSESLVPARAVDLDNVDDVAEAIRSAFTNVTKDEVPSDDSDFFKIGMDSLQVLRFTRQLRGVPGLAGIEAPTVYRNPSVSALAREIKAMASNGEAVNGGAADRAAESQRRKLQQTVQEYKQRIEELIPEAMGGDGHSDCSSRSRKQHTILVTGTTGYVGSYILDQLLSHPSSPRVICLNRSANAMSLQVTRNRERDASLATQFPPDRVVFLASDPASQTSLGLSDKDFQALLRDVTLVIYNAWPVNFNLPLSAFEPALDGLFNLIRFCSIGNHSPALLFVSSISTVMNLEAQTVPEQVVDDLQGPSSGYGESKFVAEHMLLEASRRLLLTAGVIRVGQVSGAAHTTGRWNGRDWLPRMVLSSRYLGAIPEHLGVLNNVNWIPIDVLARLVVDISICDESRPPFQIYHAMNPQATSWPKLLPSVIRTLEARALRPEQPEIVRVMRTEWVECLRKSAALDDDDMMDKLNPALKLLDFFEQTFTKEASRMLLWDTENSLRLSDTLRESASIQPEWMERWIKGFLE